ncbi:hypothetical protein [Oscillatoria sp. HE19RPO]|uniref:hypothetical protein n=1 Tax=Oscillatoria sp. HE19RPO TaxID=2954806 RepID=UPI0020C47A10|nr:hypothetical protein [Oscillatoria sp. HE19RPO]
MGNTLKPLGYDDRRSLYHLLDCPTVYLYSLSKYKLSSGCIPRQSALSGEIGAICCIGVS